MKRSLPAYTTRDRRGTIYFRRRGQPQVRMQCQEPGTAAFAAEYARLLAGIDTTTPTARTVEALCRRYVQSDPYRRLSPRTAKDYDKHMAFLRDRLGDVAVARITRPVLVRLRDSDSSAYRANATIAFLRVLFAEAVEAGWLKDNPAVGIRTRAHETRERQPWPDDKIRAFREIAPPKTRLAFELLLGTGQRIGDVLAMRWDDLRDGGVMVRQNKTKAKLWIPLTPHLRAALAEAPRDGLTILTGQHGRPWAYVSAQQAIMRIRRKIGAEAYDNHALRYTAAAEIAAAGGSDDEIAAITGHKAARMVAKYAGEARQRQRALTAQARRDRT